MHTCECNIWLISPCSLKLHCNTSLKFKPTANYGFLLNMNNISIFKYISKNNKNHVTLLRKGRKLIRQILLFNRAHPIKKINAADIQMLDT